MTVSAKEFDKALKQVLQSVGVDEDSDYVSKTQCQLLCDIVMRGENDYDMRVARPGEDQDLTAGASEKLKQDDIDAIFERDFAELLAVQKGGSEAEGIHKQLLIKWMMLRLSDQGVVLY